jgi:KDO2-lipid IV(A) lauroyltransferase
VLAFRIIRLGGAHFRAEIMPPVHFQESGNRPRDIEVAMTDVNHQLEQWIREYPGQWLWLHRRWPKWS